MKRMEAYLKLLHNEAGVALPEKEGEEAGDGEIKIDAFVEQMIEQAQKRAERRSVDEHEVRQKRAEAFAHLAARKAERSAEFSELQMDAEVK